MRLLIAGGGTGGHLFPGIAVAEEFLSRDSTNEVLFVGTARGVEARVLPTLGYRLELVSASGIRGKGFFSTVKGLAMLLFAYAESRRILKEFKPDIVLGVGGYASGPTLLAARGLLIPRYVHEQNAIPGMTNKILSRFTLQNFISLEESRRFFPEERTLLTGNPLRKQILAEVMNKDTSPISCESEESLLLQKNFHLLVFGGSLGAHSINMTMKGAAPLLATLRDRIAITHQTGDKDHQEVKAAYVSAGITAEVVPFIDNMAAAYTKADLVICRAGATTIAEVTACGKPCLFIPFPYAVDDHQRKNGEALLKKDACLMLLEQEMTPARIAKEIEGLFADQERLQQIGVNAGTLARVDAAKVIVDEMLAAITP